MALQFFCNYGVTAVGSFILLLSYFVMIYQVEMKDDMKDTLAELEQSLAKERELDNKMADQHR